MVRTISGAAQTSAGIGAFGGADREAGGAERGADVAVGGELQRAVEDAMR